MADAITVKVDTRQIEDLANVLRRGAEVSLYRIAERGQQLLRKEVPKVTHNLEQGVSSDVKVRELTATLIVSARSGRRGARQATVHYPSGTEKQITLRPQPAFDYAEAVARGRKPIVPRKAKVLLIPVASAPRGETYITSGSEIFVLRNRAKATPGDHYDERAAAQLEKDAPRIVEAQLQRVGLIT